MSRVRVRRATPDDGAGLADVLVDCVEGGAIEAGKSLFTLDTASDAAERLYERRGWRRVGVVPGFALWPDGDLVQTVIFYQQLI
jgi:hypothetical protein